MLANTSLNVRGKPIVNRLEVAVAMFVAEPLIAALVLENSFLVRRVMACYGTWNVS